MISGASRRKPNFDEDHSVPVVLGDGQAWYLPKPWQEIRPVFKGGRAASAYPVLTCGPELDALVEAISGCEEFLPRISAVASLAAHLLGRQYELSDSELDELLRVRLGEDMSDSWIIQVIDVATGRSGPKASRDGGA
jgi:hypothetical protein